MSYKSAELYSEEEIKTLVEEFETCCLPKEKWTYAAHLIVAMWYLKDDSQEAAIRRIRDGIQRLNAAQGVIATPTGGYHETLTLFWIYQVNEFLRKQPADKGLAQTVNELIRALCDSKLPLRYYSRERLFSPEARTGWVSPDGVALGDTP